MPKDIPDNVPLPSWKPKKAKKQGKSSGGGTTVGMTILAFALVIAPILVILAAGTYVVVGNLR